jgi:hypothetical protein
MKIQISGPWITDHEVRVVIDAMENGWYEKPIATARSLRRNSLLTTDVSTP